LRRRKRGYNYIKHNPFPPPTLYIHTLGFTLGLGSYVLYKSRWWWDGSILYRERH